MTATIGVTMGFAENLRTHREAKGWTQAATATEAGVPFRSYQNWEAGVREPRLDALKRLAVAFGVAVDDLLEGIGDGAPQVADAEEKPRAKGKRK